MSKVPEFAFDYKKVEGLDVTEAMMALMDQMADHYNKYIKPAPITFGGAKVAPPIFKQEYPSTQAEAAAVTAAPPVKEGKLIPVEPGWEIKNGGDLGLKQGKILTGVRSDTKVEIFDFLKNYEEGTQIVEGDSGKYDLGRS